MPEVNLPLLAQLFDILPVGVVVLDRAGSVVVYNRAEEQLAQRSRDQVLGRSFFTEVAPCMNVKELGETFRARIGAGAFERKIDFRFPFPFLDQPRDVVVTLRSFESSGEPFAFLMVEDVSFQRSIDRMKETLAGLLVHDLKNPLAGVIMNLDLLAESASVVSHGNAMECVVDARGAAVRLQAMLVNLLDVTRLETDTLPLQRAMFEPSALLGDIVEASRVFARDKVKLVLEVPESLPTYGDAALLRRALDNLVENAIRFARTRVTLRVTADSGAVSFDVEDDGAGVPEELRSKVFERYGQAASPKNHAHNRGLGLTFVQLAARAHGGDCTILAAPSGGAIFRVMLPRVRPSIPS